jgi:preprotein translocase subunit SecE
MKTMPLKEMNDPKAPQPKNWLESIKEWPEITRNYFAELQLEMKRVTWPNRKQVEGTTVIVIFTVFGFAAYFWVVDAVLVRSIGAVQRVFTK